MKKVAGLAFIILVFACTLGVIYQFGIAQETNPSGGRQRPEAANDQDKSQLSPEQKLAAWKGQKVTILGTQALSCPPKRGSQVFFHKFGGDERDFLPYEKYAGQTGIVVEAKMGS